MIRCMFAPWLWRHKEASCATGAEMMMSCEESASVHHAAWLNCLDQASSVPASKASDEGRTTWLARNV